jgi:thermostable 8-oxoguanine DNA glycosylase
VSIEMASRKIMEINQNVTQATSSEREEDYSKELEPCVKTTNKKAASAKKIL